MTENGGIKGVAEVEVKMLCDQSLGVQYDFAEERCSVAMGNRTIRV